MPEVEQPGRYRAQVLEAAFGETKKGTPYIGLNLRMTEQFVEDAWVDVSEYQLEIVYDYFFMYSAEKGGGLNEKAIARLVEVFGWNGTDLKWLTDTQLPDCQAIIEDQPWEGRDGEMHHQLRVTWINHYDDTRGMGGGRGNMPKSDDAITARLQSVLGAGLRALNGGTSSSTPSPAPARRQAPRPAPASPPKTETSVYSAFVAATNTAGNWTKKQLEDAWNAALGSVIDAEGFVPDPLTHADCVKVEAYLARALAEHKRDAAPADEAPWPGE